MTPKERPRLESLDVARGAAAMLVLLEHGLHWSLPEYLAFSKNNVVIGQAAIMVLFMVSAFVVPLSLDGKQSLRQFWHRRAFRLVPVYWFSIVLAAFALLLGQTAGIATTLADGPTWLTNITLTQRLAARPDIWGVFWSLHFEIGLYVLVSALFVLGMLRSIGPRTMILAIIAFTAITTAMPVLTQKPPGDGGLRMALLSMMFGFTAYLHVNGRLSRRGFHAFAIAMLAAPLLAEGAIALALPAVDTTTRMLRCGVIMGVAIGCFTLAMESRQRVMPAWAVALGQRSYPIYLVHPFVLTMLVPLALPAVAFVPAVIVLTLLLAESAHRLVERPCIALGRRLEHRGARSHDAAILAFPSPRSAAQRKAA